jgi:hypothetical protein
LIVISAIVLVVVGVVVVVSLQNLGKTPAAAPGSSAAAVASSAASLAPDASAGASPAASVAAPVLEGLMPKAVNGTTLTVQSAAGASALSSGPSGRALDAAVTILGKKPTDLEVAVAYDATSALDVSVLAFRIAGEDPSKLLPAVLDGWLAANAPGVTTSTVAVAGTSTTEVSYGTGPKDYVFVYKDAVFVVESADPAVPGEAVAAITGAPVPSAPATLTPTSPAPSGAAGSSPAPSPASS